MKIISILTIISLLTYEVKAQSDIPVFSDYTALWQQQTWDRSKPQKYIPYRFVDSKIEGDKLYNLYWHRINVYNDWLDDGGYLQCLDVESGELLWDYYWDIKDSASTNERPMELDFSDSNYVVIIGRKYKFKYQKLNGKKELYSSTLTRRILNRKDGSLQYQTYGDSTDTMTSYTWWKTYYYKMQNNRFIGIFGLFYASSDTNTYVGYVVVDSTGKTQRRDSLKIPRKYGRYIDLEDVKRLRGDTFYTTIYYDNNKDQKSEEFRYTYYYQELIARGDSLRLGKRVDIDIRANHHEFYTWDLIQADPEYFMVYNNVLYPTKYEMAIYSRSTGGLIDTVDLKALHTILLSVKTTRKDELMIIGSNYAKAPFAKTYVYRKKIGQPAELLKGLTPTFRWYMFRAVKIILLEDKDLIVTGYLTQVDKDIGGFTHIRLMTLRMSGSDFGLTKTEEVGGEREESQLKITPSMARNYIKTIWRKSMKGELRIYDIMGKEWKRVRIVKEEKAKQIEITGLPPGQYYVQMTEGRTGRIYKARPFIKI